MTARERDFWIAVRRALLALVAALDRYLEIDST